MNELMNVFLSRHPHILYENNAYVHQCQNNDTIILIFYELYGNISRDVHVNFGRGLITIFWQFKSKDSKLAS